jgi:hypothetical protein
LLILEDQLFDLVYLLRRKSLTANESNRIEPKLCLTLVTVNMNVRRLVAITSVENSRYGPLRNTVGPPYYDR